MLRGCSILTILCIVLCQLYSIIIYKKRPFKLQCRRSFQTNINLIHSLSDFYISAHHHRSTLDTRAQYQLVLLRKNLPYLLFRLSSVACSDQVVRFKIASRVQNVNYPCSTNILIHDKHRVINISLPSTAFHYSIGIACKVYLVQGINC